MFSNLKLFSDEGMPKLKKEELKHVREGLHVTGMTKVVQALSRLDSVADLIVGNYIHIIYIYIYIYIYIGVNGNEEKLHPF